MTPSETFQRLEPRNLLSATMTVGADVNISRTLGNQTEPTIAVDPTNPSHLFASSNLDTGSGVFAAYSTNGGVTWTSRTIADGSDNLLTACCDPNAAFDSFGNLFLTYLCEPSNQVAIVRSSDGGKTFARVAAFGGGSMDQPSVSAAAGSVWISFQKNGQIFGTGARVNGLGAVGTFLTPQLAPGSDGGNFGDTMIGPNGQVAVVYQAPSDGEGPSTIYANVDANGLAAGGFGPPITVTSTNVGGFDTIPAQKQRKIDAEAGLAWDRTNGPHRGRLYLVYTEETVNENNDTNILLRYSDNNGASWSKPIRVNDDTTTYSQFFPRVSLDPTTGNIAVSWYDARNDNGKAPGSTNSTPNDDVQVYATVSNDGGASFSPNVRLAAGPSNAAQGTDGNDFGDYSGLAFQSGAFYAIWVDNSATLPGNPSRPQFDLATSKVTVTTGTLSPVVSIAATDASAAETRAGLAANTGTFTVSRTGPTTAALTVSYTVGGTATNGADYTTIPASVVIPAGKASITITIAPIDDAAAEPTETVILTLATSTAYAVDTATPKATVSIADNDTSASPANDNFASRTVLTGSNVNTTGSNANATLQAGEPRNANVTGGRSVWWTWTAPDEGDATISLAGTTFDTTLGVYTGGTVTALNAIASNDDENSAAGIFTSRLTFATVPGTAYQISVDGLNGVSGRISLQLQFSALPANLVGTAAANPTTAAANGPVPKPAPAPLQAIMASTFGGHPDFSPASFTNVNGTLYFQGTAGPGIRTEREAPPADKGNQLWKSDGTSAGTVLVHEFAPADEEPTLQYLTNVNGTLFFQADDGTSGGELWKSDGTDSGTVLVRDINPGEESGAPRNFANVNGVLYFRADDGTHGQELWKSDGTSSGTVLVHDINPGSSSFPYFLTNVNGLLFFSANDGSHGFELWKSDGSDSGTVLVRDVLNGVADAFPTSLINVNGALFFQANDGSHGFELWTSNGTSSGTGLVRDILPGAVGAYPGSLTNVNGTLFFEASDGTHGFELWKSNGTSGGTTLVRDVKPGSLGAYPATLANAGGILYFAADDGTHGIELWKSDGTSAGTSLVLDIKPGAYGSSIAGIANVGGKLYFRADDGTHGSELWKSNGTASGTQLVADINAGGNGSVPGPVANLNGTVFFAANDGTTGRELWKSDGTASGTQLIHNVNTSAQNGTQLTAFVNIGGTLYFVANDGTHGAELWKNDGTSSGTVLVADIHVGPAGSYPVSLTNVNGTLFFAADDGTNGQELWKSDGTASGTVLVADISFGPEGSYLSELINVHGTLFFSADDGAYGSELWTSDGTDSGTVLVADVGPGVLGSYPSYLTDVNGTLFFQADDGTHGAELWKSDGTNGGAVLVADISSGAYGSYPSFLENANGTLYFQADDGLHGFELWKSNGTNAGTLLVRDVSPGSSGSYPTAFISVNGTTYFSADDGTQGSELWKTNGTSSGTVLVRDMNPGTADSSPDNLVNGNGTLFFQANDGSHGFELWKSNGTSAGTALVREINPGPDGSYPVSLLNVSGTLYFRANDGVSGEELWRSDGSSSGTVLEQEIHPDEEGSSPDQLTNLNGTLAFSANGDAPGVQLWLLGSKVPNAAVTTPAPAIDVAAASTTTTTITVTYAAGAGIDASTFSTGNITVDHGATVTGFSFQGDVVTYTIKAPASTWKTSAQVTYTIGLTASVKDLAGNPIAANPAFAAFLVDTVAPSGTWSAIASPTATSVPSASITFSEPVRNVTLGSFTLNGTDLSTLPGVSLSNAGNVYTISGLSAYNGINQLGKVYGLSLATGNQIVDAASNPVSPASVTWTYAVPISLSASASHVAVQVQNGQLTVVDTDHGNQVLGSQSASIPLVIQGSNAPDNTLTLDLTGVHGGATLTFHGVSGVQNTINVSSGTFTGSLYQYTGAHDGSLQLAAGSGLFTINYTNLTPLVNSASSTDATFNLPSGASAAVESAGAGLSRLASDNGAFEVTTFANPTGALAINVGGSSTLKLHALPGSATSATLTTSGNNAVFQTQPGTFPQSFVAPSGSTGEVLILDLTRIPGTSHTLPPSGSGTLTFDGKSNVMYSHFDSIVPVSRLFRAYNDHIGQHFYTSSPGEFDILTSLGLHDESTGQDGFAVLQAQAASSLPLLRLYNPNGGQHYYTLNSGEAQILLGLGWNSEGHEGFLFTSAQPGMSEIFHLYNTANGEHIFTESISYRDALMAQSSVWALQRSLGFGAAVTAADLPAATPSAAVPQIAAAEFAAAGALGGSGSATPGNAGEASTQPLSLAIAERQSPISLEGTETQPDAFAQPTSANPAPVNAADDYWTSLSSQLSSDDAIDADWLN